MLRVLQVKNFALIDELTVNFDAGLTVITGETGAGKSIIVEAVAALCGERIEEVSIRRDRTQTEISGVFDAPAGVQTLLEKSGVSAGGELIVRRQAERGKKQLSYVNDQLVGLNLLKSIAGRMVDLVGQYENQSLFFAANHRELLDRYGRLDALHAGHRRNFTEYRRLERELREHESAAQTAAEKTESLRYDIAEIEKVGLRPGEEEQLNSDRLLLASAERRSKLTEEITSELYESDAGIYSRLARVKKLVEELGTLDSTLDESVRKVETAVNITEETYRALSRYRQRIDFSGERLESIMARLDAIGRLKKKYGRTQAEIAACLDTAKRELGRIENRDAEIRDVRTRLAEVEGTMRADCERFSQKRKAAAKLLEKKITKVLAALGMNRAQFSLRFMPREIDEDGREDVEFYISTNPGEEPKPLRKIGSGGEVSRITLALKTILSEIDAIPTVIFDEVDTGIGGRVAESVGELLHGISRQHQIICVTHLPQITVHADQHLLVEKRSAGNETVARVKKLDGETRKLEVARMLGGKEITSKTVEHAAEILQKSRPR